MIVTFSYPGKEYHTFSTPLEEQISMHSDQLLIKGVDERPNSAVQRMLHNAKQLNLVPVRKLI